MLRSRGPLLFLILVLGAVSASPARGEDDARQKALDGAELLVTQNGIRPIRVARLTLDASSAKVVRAELLEKNSPLSDEPTLGVLVGDDFYYIANPQWGSFESGKVLPPDKLQEPTILKVTVR